jgi:NTF2 fold immunity protein
MRFLLVRRPFAILCLGFLLSCIPLTGASSGKTYTPKAAAELDVLSLVIASEIKANNWKNNELICFSVGGLNPSSKLLRALRQRGFNMRSSGEWAKKFNCGFELQLEYTQFDLSRSIKVRSKLIDLREINKGEGDLALLEKDGEYSMQKIDEKWSISDYTPKPQPPATKVRVPDAATALSIAEPALIKVYGKRQIDDERPLTATLDDGIWSVHGTLCCPDAKGQRTCDVGKCLGGVAVLNLRQSDGKILSISHTK